MLRVATALCLSMAVVTDAYSKSPIPDPPCGFNCSTTDEKSPWNFWLDFETNEWKQKLRVNDKGNPQGWKPFEIKTEADGNKYLSMTVQHGWNTGKGRGKNTTERAELLTKRQDVYGKNVWHGFKIRNAAENPFTGNRLLLAQYYLRLENIGTKNPIPLVAVKYDEVSADSLRIEFYPCEGTINTTLYSRFGNETPYQEPYCSDYGSLPGKYEVSSNPDGVKPLSSDKEWTTYVIGVRVTSDETGFIEIYQNKELVFRWKGPTYGYSKRVPAEIKFGPYRNMNPRKGEKYPPQTFHVDDFVVGSSIQDVTKILWK